MSFKTYNIIISYLLYVLDQEQCSKRPVTHKRVRCSLVESLVHETMSTNGRMHKAKQDRQCIGSPEEKPNGEPHFIETKEKVSSACIVCKANKPQKEMI